MKKLIPLFGILLSFPVYAHETEDPLIGSNLWKWIFFLLLYAFVLLVLWRLVTDYVHNSIVQKLLKIFVGILALSVAGYVIYHTFID